jgi:N-acetylmuramoyl-L-alanine amidase
MGKDRYKVKDLAMCRETICPAVLTENLFQDNRADVDYLLTDDGFNAIVGLHIAAIKRYVTTYG